MPDQSKIDIIHTSCKKCVFADYNDNTQIGCMLGLIEKLNQKNIEIIEVYDNEKEFFVVNNKKCVGYKEEIYFENRGMIDASIEEKINYIKQKLVINYAIVINLNKYNDKSMNKLSKAISELTIKPSVVYAIRYKKDRTKYSYDKVKTFLDDCKIPKWKIKTILNNKESYENIIHHTINENKANKFVLSINGNFDSIETIVLKAQKIIYEELSRFIVLSNSKKQSILFNTDVYRFALHHNNDILTNTKEYEII